MECWKNIKGYDGQYQVSNMGRVKSLNYNRTGKEKIMKQRRDKDGYCILNLCYNGFKKTYKVHRLVASAFLPNPDKLPQINHKNNIRSCNELDNLEWCDCKYNINYKWKNAG